MRCLVGGVKILLLGLLVVFGLLAGIVSAMFPGGWYLKLAGIWHQLVLRVTGIRLEVTGHQITPGALMISNHLSWLDIPLIGSRLPVVFLAKHEISGWPVLGWLVRRAGTLFIDRSTRAHSARQQISDTLVGGQSVVLFPEGRITDGTAAIRFHSRLFQSALDANTVVQPIALDYRNRDGSRAEHVGFHGEASFLRSLWNVVCGPPVLAGIRVFSPISGELERDQIAREAERRVENWLKARNS